MTYFVRLISYFEFIFYRDFHNYKHWLHVIKLLSLIDKATQYTQFSRLPKGNERDFKKVLMLMKSVPIEEGKENSLEYVCPLLHSALVFFQRTGVLNPTINIGFCAVDSWGQNCMKDLYYVEHPL